MKFIGGGSKKPVTAIPTEGFGSSDRGKNGLGMNSGKRKGCPCYHVGFRSEVCP